MGKQGQGQILAQVLAEASRMKDALVVFDLDSTLLNVQPRTLQIFKDFVKQKPIQRQFPLAYSVISNMGTLSDERYRIEDHISDLGLEGLGEDFLQQLITFWKRHFFSNDYLKHDLPYTGVFDFLMALKSHQVNILYLTGRSQKMEDGTRKSLLDLGFPLESEQARLILKAEKSMDDAFFKKKVILEMDRKHKPIWFFENEPFIVNPIFRELPHIQVIFVDTVHSNRESDPHQNIPQIQSFHYQSLCI